MLKQRLTITLAQSTLNQIDRLIDKQQIRSRSHAIESILKKHLEPTIDTAVILAGGKNCDSNQIIKPLIIFKQKPLIVHLFNHLKKFGVNKVVILAKKGSEIIKTVVLESFPEIQTTYFFEDKQLGTAGAIKNIKSYLPKTFFCLHADIYTDINLQQLACFHTDHQSIATIAVKPKISNQFYDNVFTQGTQVTDFQPKDKLSEVNLVNTGVYVFESEMLEFIPQHTPSTLEKDVFPQLAKKNQLFAYTFQGEWLDVTTDPAYLQNIKKKQL